MRVLIIWTIVLNTSKIKLKSFFALTMTTIGLQLRNELARRFGQHRCKYVDFGEYKDANEVLTTKGAETLRNVIKSAKNFPLEGILNVNDIWENVLSYNEKGVQNYSIGLAESDSFFKMSWGEWTVVTKSVPNSGKSDIVDQIFCNVATIWFSLCYVRLNHFRMKVT